MMGVSIFGVLMRTRAIQGALLVLMGFGLMPAASAAGTHCLGFFENTQYASLFGVARYQMVCDNGKEDSVQRSWVYSDESHERFYREEVPALARKFGVSRIGVRKDNLSGSYDVYGPQGAARPEHIALLSRSLFRMGDGWLETIQVQEAGRTITYPKVTIATPKDLRNVNKIVEGESWRRSGVILPSRHTAPNHGVFVLYR